MEKSWKSTQEEKYNPAASAVLQAVYALQGARPSERLEKVGEYASDLGYNVLNGIGVPRQFTGPGETKYSPMSQMVQQMAGVEPEDIDERRALEMTLGIGAGVVGGVTVDAMKLARSTRAITKMELLKKLGISGEVVKAGSWKEAMNTGLTDKILELQETAGQVTHPSLVDKASDLVHDIKGNYIQKNVLEEEVRSLKTKARTKKYLTMAEEMKAKIDELTKKIPEALPNIDVAKENMKALRLKELMEEQ